VSLVGHWAASGVEREASGSGEGVTCERTVCEIPWICREIVFVYPTHSLRSAHHSATARKRSRPARPGHASRIARACVLGAALKDARQALNVVAGQAHQPRAGRELVAERGDAVSAC
jgi:hypothetical protein